MWADFNDNLSLDRQVTVKRSRIGCALSDGATGKDDDFITIRISIHFDSYFSYEPIDVNRYFMFFTVKSEHPNVTASQKKRFQTIMAYSRLLSKTSEIPWKTMSSRQAHNQLTASSSR